MSETNVTNEPKTKAKKMTKAAIEEGTKVKNTLIKKKRSPRKETEPKAEAKAKVKEAPPETEEMEAMEKKVKKTIKVVEEVKAEPETEIEESEEVAETPRTPVNEYKNPALAYLDKEQLEDKKLLIQILAKQIGERSVTVPKKATAEELAHLIEGDYLVESAEREDRFADTHMDIKMVDLDDIAICPLNPRHQLDYLDENLQASMKKANGLTRTITLTPAHDFNPKAKVPYYVVAGNRSFTNLKYLVESGEVTLEGNKVPVVVRVYTANSEAERQSQMLAELEADNDEAMPFTPIDRLKLVNSKLALGRSKSSIAREKGWSPAYVTQLCALNNLPENILNLVHFGFRSEILSQKSPAELSKNGVPHSVDEKGNVKILSISYNNAQTMANLFPKRKDFKTQEEFDSETSRILAVINDEETINKAMSLTEARFSVAMLPHKVVNKSVEKVDVKTPEKKETAKELEKELEEEVIELQGKTKEEDLHPLIRMLMVEPHVLAEGLRKDPPVYDFTADWAKVLATQVEEGDSKTIKALKHFIELSIFDEIPED